MGNQNIAILIILFLILLTWVLTSHKLEAHKKGINYLSDAFNQSEKTQQQLLIQNSTLAQENQGLKNQLVNTVTQRPRKIGFDLGTNK